MVQTFLYSRTCYMILPKEVLTCHFGFTFFFFFCFTRGEQVTDAQDFGWQSMGEGHFRSWFPFFFFVYLVTILCCSDIVWSKDLSTYFFCFLPIFDQELSFFFTFSHSLIGNFPFLLFFLFSFEGTD